MHIAYHMHTYIHLPDTYGGPTNVPGLGSRNKEENKGDVIPAFMEATW